MKSSILTLVANNSTDASFRAWAQWIHDQLAAAGLVQTADTGQINLATVLKPAATGTAQGYEIWRFADALQATAPIFIKLEYGSANANVADPSVWVTVGTQSSGAGTLTGNVSTRRQLFAANNAAAFACYFSGSTNRFSFALWTGATNTPYIFFGVERAHDAAGADTNEGAFFINTSLSGNLHGFAQQMIPSVGTVPPVHLLMFAVTEDAANGVNANFGADVFTFPIYPLNVYLRNPSLNWVAYYNADFAAEIEVPISIYGASHQFMPTGRGPGLGGNTLRANANLRLMMRYE